MHFRAAIGLIVLVLLGCSNSQTTTSFSNAMIRALDGKKIECPEWFMPGFSAAIGGRLSRSQVPVEPLELVCAEIPGLTRGRSLDDDLVEGFLSLWNEAYRLGREEGGMPQARARYSQEDYLDDPQAQRWSNSFRASDYTARYTMLVIGDAKFVDLDTVKKPGREGGAFYESENGEEVFPETVTFASRSAPLLDPGVGDS